MRNAIDTSLVIVSTVSLVGAGVRLAAGNTLDPGLTVVLTGACVAGAALGGSVQPRGPQRDLGRAFTALVGRLRCLPTRLDHLPRRACGSTPPE